MRLRATRIEEDPHAGHTQPLRRGLFGFRTKAVHGALADREMVLRLAQERAEAAERTVRELDEHLSSARADAGAAKANVATLEATLSSVQVEAEKLRGQVAAVRAELATRDEVVRALRTEMAAKDERARLLREEQARLQEEVAALRDSASSKDSATVAYLMEQVSPIIAAAEESARRMTEQAQRRSELQAQETHRLRRSMQSELTRFGKWRDQIEGLVVASKAHFKEAKVTLAEVPELVAEALGSATRAIDVVNEDLGRLAETSIPAMIVELSEVEPESEGPARVPNADSSGAVPLAGASPGGT